MFNSATWLSVLVLAIAGQQGQTTRIVRLPESTPAGLCRFADSGAPLARTLAGLHLQCDRPGSIVCDFQGVEPVDLLVADVCQSGLLSLSPAVSRPLPTGPEWTAVEWLTWEDGAVPVVVAARPASQISNLLVARHKNRYVRFQRPGFPPATFHESAIPSVAPWHPTRHVTGGELLFTVAPAVVVPLKIRLRNSSASDPGEYTLGDVGGRLIVGGLSGTVTWQPVYEGDIGGETVELEVPPGSSVAIVMAPSDVGRVKVAIDRELCANSGRLDVVRLTRTPTGAQLRSRVARRDFAHRCDQIFSGLPPGEYELVASGEGVGFAVTKVVQVERQVETTAILSLPDFEVIGTVTLDGRPYPSADLQVSFAEPDVPPTEGVTASVLSAGDYSLRLPRSGTYVARLTMKGLPLIGREQTVVIHEGQNRVDWSVTGGTLVVVVEGWDQASPVTFTFSRQTPGSRISRVAFDLKPPASPSMEFPGFSEGDYVVRARQERPDRTVVVAAPRQVAVKATGDSKVVLTLASYDTEITVMDSAGQPLPSAQLRTQNGRLEQSAPGIFRATAGVASPGEFIDVIAPGHIATCLVAPGSGQPVAVRLLAGFPTSIEVLGAGRYGVLPGTVTWTGAQCPIRLGSLDATQVGTVTQSDGTVVSRFSVSQLPPAHQLLYSSTLGATPVQLKADDRGVVVIDRSRQIRAPHR